MAITTNPAGSRSEVARRSDGGFAPAYARYVAVSGNNFLSNAWRRATWGMGQASVPSRFLLEIPADLMVGPQLRREDVDDEERLLDPDLVFGSRRTSRFGQPTRSGGGAWRQGSGRPGAPASGEGFVPSRDLAAKRDAYHAGARSGSLVPSGSAHATVAPEDAAAWRVPATRGLRPA
jgi:hypothetical protein